jgi:hypothetical protein
MRAPTRKQYDKLLVLGSGAAGLSWLRRDTKPLLRRGWVTAEDPDGSYFQMVRITPLGLRALADAVELYGLPEIGPVIRHAVRACSDCGSRRHHLTGVWVDPRTGCEAPAPEKVAA